LNIFSFTPLTKKEEDVENSILWSKKDAAGMSNQHSFITYLCFIDIHLSMLFQVLLLFRSGEGKKQRVLSSQADIWGESLE
jgi:hypothetical protein